MLYQLSQQRQPFQPTISDLPTPLLRHPTGKQVQPAEDACILNSLAVPASLAFRAIYRGPHTACDFFHKQAQTNHILYKISPFTLLNKGLTNDYIKFCQILWSLVIERCRVI